jgi:hypothetical protein
MAIVNLRSIFQLPAAAATLVVVVALAVAACGGGGGGAMNSNGCLGYGGGGGGGGGGNCMAHPVASPMGTPVGILLNGENPVSVAPYGNVLGYFNGTSPSAPNGSNVVNLVANTNVQFVNFDTNGGFGAHTASFLGAWSGSFPGTFTNSNGATASAAGAVITSANFSSGAVNPGTASAVYNSGGPGMFVFGCAFHYMSNNMRTVVIVH